MAPLGAIIAQVKGQTSANGIEFMDSPHQAMMAALRWIRDQANSVLKRIEQPQEQHSVRWKCKESVVAFRSVANFVDRQFCVYDPL
jgi:hypothetical protein